MDTRDYSKEEILELIEQTKERYNISDMSALGTILGEYNHNWYYYYKNHAKKIPDFLDALVAVQEPQEMFERLRAATDRLMQKKNIEKKEMKRLFSYAKSMVCCVVLIGERFAIFMQEGKKRLETVQDPYDKQTCAIAIIDQGWEQTTCFGKSLFYVSSLLFYFAERKAKMVQGGMISAKNRRKENFDLKACYEAHCNTPEFELSRKKNLDSEEEKAVCWYKVRCNNIKLCKFYEFSQKVVQLDTARKNANRQFEKFLNNSTKPEELMTLYKELCEMLQELEMQEE